MRIGIFTTDFPYKEPFTSKIKKDKMFWGGVGEVVYQSVLALNKRGYEIKIFTTSMINKDEIQKYENITVYRYKKKLKIESTNLSLGLLTKPLKHEVDIVQIHGTSPPGAMAGYVYAKKNKKPFVLSYHGDVEAKYGGFVKKNSMNFFINFLLYRILDDAKIITVLSESFLKESKFLGRYVHKVVIVPNGINLDEFSSGLPKEDCRKELNLPYDKKIVLFVGGLTPRKALDILIKAMKKITKEIPH